MEKIEYGGLWSIHAGFNPQGGSVSDGAAEMVTTEGRMVSEDRVVPLKIGGHRLWHRPEPKPGTYSDSGWATDPRAHIGNPVYPGLWRPGKPAILVDQNAHALCLATWPGGEINDGFVGALAAIAIVMQIIPRVIPTLEFVRKAGKWTWWVLNTAVCAFTAGAAAAWNVVKVRVSDKSLSPRTRVGPGRKRRRH